MPRQKRTRPRPEPEYRLLIAPHVAERTQRHTTRFILETVKAFATFRYELSVATDVTDKEIRLHVLGFRTPHLSLPAAGPARYEQEFETLSGTYDVTVRGIDGRTDTFGVRFAPGEVELLRSPRHPFVQVSTDPHQWSTA